MIPKQGLKDFHVLNSGLPELSACGSTGYFHSKVEQDVAMWSKFAYGAVDRGIDL